MALAHRYRELLPARPLQPYVECYWEATSEGATGFEPIELLVPDLRVELIVNAGEPYAWSADAQSEPKNSPRFGCIGMRGRALAIQQPGRLKHFAVRFRPGGLSAFTRVPLSQLTQVVSEVDALWGRHSAELEQRILDATTSSERVLAADRFLLSRLPRLQERSELSRRCATALVNSGGLAPIAEVARQHRIGYKQLERAFARDVGLSPKHFAKIARLQRTLEIAVRNPDISLTLLACEVGYADQAHMTREFAALIGRSPRAFFAERFAVFETMKASGSVGLKPAPELDGHR
jgi:AraC-like DNA-binding protein